MADAFYSNAVEQEQLNEQQLFQLASDIMRLQADTKDRMVRRVDALRAVLGDEHLEAIEYFLNMHTDTRRLAQGIVQQAIARQRAAQEAAVPAAASVPAESTPEAPSKGRKKA